MLHSVGAALSRSTSFKSRLLDGRPSILMQAQPLRPRGYQHAILVGLLFICSFALFALPVLFGIRRYVPRSISLDANSTWFSPVIANGVQLHYVGLGIPAIITLAFIIFVVRRIRGGEARPPSGTRFLLPVIVVSALVSKLTVLGLLPAVGLTDPILLTAITLFVYWQAVTRPLVDAVPIVYSAGFFLGFMSDLESQLQSSGGVFGGHGFADGDFIYPLAYVFGTIVVSKSWQKIVQVTRRKIKEGLPSPRGRDSSGAAAPRWSPKH